MYRITKNKKKKKQWIGNGAVEKKIGDRPMAKKIKEREREIERERGSHRVIFFMNEATIAGMNDLTNL